MFLLVFCDRKYFKANSKIKCSEIIIKKKWRRLFTFCTSGNTNKRQIKFNKKKISCHRKNLFKKKNKIQLNSIKNTK